jgi:hypothetical protein
MRQSIRMQEYNIFKRKQKSKHISSIMLMMVMELDYMEKSLTKSGRHRLFKIKTKKKITKLLKKYDL